MNKKIGKMTVAFLSLLMIALMIPLFAANAKTGEKLVVIMMGAPGSGKGTQAARLSKELAIPHISTGDLFRDNISRRTKLGLEAQSYIDAGKLGPDRLVTDMLQDRLSQEDAKKGYLLDGYPRRMTQVHTLEEHLNPSDRLVVLNLKVSDEEVTKRLLARKRSDDTPEVVAHRLEVFHEETKPILDYYRSMGVLIEVNGEQTPDQVFEELKRVVQPRIAPK